LGLTRNDDPTELNGSLSQQGDRAPIVSVT